MDRGQLAEIESWMFQYIHDHYGEDEFVNGNLRLKEVHTELVMKEMADLTAALELEPGDCVLASAVALLHDIGRFDQFVQYGTYNDAESFRHGCHGAKIIEREDILNGLPRHEQKMMLCAVRHHGDKEMPDHLDSWHTQHLQLIRDADKLDIFRVIRKQTELYRIDPKKFLSERKLPTKSYVSKHVLACLLRGEAIDYHSLQTVYDMRVLQLAWIFDVNYDYTLNQILNRGFIQEILEFLPQSSELSQVARRIEGYLQQRLGRGL